MRNKILLSLALLFSLFLAGAGLSMLYLYNTTTNLRSIINLHRVEILRQDLVINAQTVQSHLYSFGTSFGAELDVIVDNVIKLDKSANKCLQCHHDEEMTLKLEEVNSLVEQYQDSLSYLITTTANEERVRRLRLVAIGIGSTLLNKAQEMSRIAGDKLKDRTFQSLGEIEHSRNVLIMTLILSFFIAIGIALTMIRQVTGPIYDLVDATRHIQKGELGFTASYKGTDEFAELFQAFNEMSVSLDHSNKKVLKHISNLSNLDNITLTFHSITNETDIYIELARGAADLVGAEQAGFMKLENDEFIHTYPAAGLDIEATRKIRFPKRDILGLYDTTRRRAYVNNGELSSSPTADVDLALNVRNIALVWVRTKGEITGAIRVANKRSGAFSSEDIQPLAILANNASVALENARLYNDLKQQMQQIQSAQEQLIQAAKLVAIGELSSNVAHELNNPLTTVLGSIDLMMEDAEEQGSIMSDLETIKSECLRAKGIIRQLLEFARKRPIQKKDINLRKTLMNVIELVSIQTRDSEINIQISFDDDIVISGDENQLKQVFINIIHNAFHAMEHKGSLEISSNLINNYVHIAFKDNGPGIKEDDIMRVFEPFFSTKKEKGTGIGLSVSFKIIQEHNGTIEVKNTPDSGAIFTVVLPVS
jgi:signal transduction histidine kinase/HAMP domain-containing protein